MMKSPKTKTEHKLTIPVFTIRLIKGWLTVVRKGCELVKNPETGESKMVCAIEQPLFLHGPASRARNQVLRLLDEAEIKVMQAIAEEQKKYAVIDEATGEAKRTEDGNLDIPEEKKVEFNNFFYSKLAEETTIQVAKSDLAAYKTVHELLINLTTEFNIDETEILDRVIVEFSKI